jgi:hypothetical protein
MMHEITEQYFWQIHGMPYPTAHPLALKCQSMLTG